MGYEKCYCGELCDIEDLVKSEVSNKMTCPNCGVYCPECGKLISESDMVGNVCIGCNS